VDTVAFMFGDADVAVSARPVTVSVGRPVLVVPVVQLSTPAFDATGRVFLKRKKPLRMEHKKDA